MEQYLTEQYLARIGYASGSEQQIPEPDPTPRPDVRLATIDEVQAKILYQLKEQHSAQQQASPAISSRPANQTRMLDLREEAILSIHPEPSHDYKSPSPKTKTEVLVGLHSELERRQIICLGIERQIEACQKEIRTHPSKQKKIEKEHEKRIAESVKPERDEKQMAVDVEKGKDAKTAEEAEFEEMRDLYLQYDREVIGVPNAELVDAFFVAIADTEHHLQKAEEAKRAAKRREAKLEEKLYKARCSIFEIEDEIEEVENGAMAQDARESKVGESRSEGLREGKGKGEPRRRKRVKHRQQGEGGDEKVRRRRKRRTNTSGKAGKISLDTAF
ncbi:MAG: hypothetical protein ASARMPREDX12_009324 [Alectoria sarmentosa]|nr:MAG: hypothetical protein ASARMPREDX12_009324 [Alectoria sarmentosa]